jgi:ABC-2 type transport system ATP-binding protein
MQVRQHVGYLPENVPLYRDMTALAYLSYIGEIRGVPQRKARALDVLGKVGLGKRAHSTIRTLSKGMRQRVGMAAALVHDPQVLILDEPTIGLDPIQVLELRDLVSELGRDHTVLFSTHILSEAEQVCDRVVIINQGEILVQGDPSTLRAELERGQRILIRTVESLEQSLPLVQNLDVVAEAKIERDAIIAIPRDAQIDPRPIIIQALVSQGFNVLEVRPAASSLEEIFLELTHASAPEAHAVNEDMELVAAGSENATSDEAESEV